MVWLLVLVAIGCARDNPEFGDSTSGDSGPKPGTESGVVTESTTAAATTSGADATGFDTEAVTSGGDTLDSGPVDTGADTGVQQCPTPVHSFVGVEMFDAGDVRIPPDCANTMPGGMIGPITVSGSGITAQNCGACPCTEAGIPVTAQITGPVDIPALPACGRITAWAEPGPMGGCRWAGLAVFSENNNVPEWLATDSRTVPTQFVNGLSVGLTDAEPCPSDGCDGAGLKALVFGDTPLTMDDPPTLLELPFAAAIPYVVDNLISYVDPECVEHVAWTAIAP
jgi:hypothetical protein